jgi:hypothetical protein
VVLVGIIGHVEGEAGRALGALRDLAALWGVTYALIAVR